MELARALGATSGLVCVVGAGGKKSTLYALADRLDSAVVTATVRIPIFDDHVATVRVTERPTAAVRAAGPNEWPLGLVPERERSDRYRGYDPERVADLARRGEAEAVLVKADGARMRELKAPNDSEPRLPAGTDTVLPIASVHAAGEPLTEAGVHRPDRAAAITGREIGEPIRPADVAAVLASPDGGLKDAGDATVIPVLNKVDDPDLEAVAREIATEIHERTDVERVALTRLAAAEPLVDVVE